MDAPRSAALDDAIKPPPHRNPHDALERKAREGDAAAIYEWLLRARWLEVDMPRVFGLLFRAIDVASKTDPAGFSTEAFRLMLNSVGYIALRMQLSVFQSMEQDDQRNQGRSADIAREVVDDLLPRLYATQQHLAQIAQAMASSARQWQLARQRQWENEQAQRDSQRMQKEHDAPCGCHKLSKEAG